MMSTTVFWLSRCWRRPYGIIRCVIRLSDTANSLSGSRPKISGPIMPVATPRVMSCSLWVAPWSQRKLLLQRNVGLRASPVAQASRLFPPLNRPKRAPAAVTWFEMSRPLRAWRRGVSRASSSKVERRWTYASVSWVLGTAPCFGMSSGRSANSCMRLMPKSWVSAMSA